MSNYPEGSGTLLALRDAAETAAERHMAEIADDLKRLKAIEEALENVWTICGAQFDEPNAGDGAEDIRTSIEDLLTDLSKYRSDLIGGD